jgi:hypothetical protein
MSAGMFFLRRILSTKVLLLKELSLDLKRGSPCSKGLKFGLEKGKSKDLAGMTNGLNAKGPDAGLSLANLINPTTSVLRSLIPL